MREPFQPPPDVTAALAGAAPPTRTASVVEARRIAASQGAAILSGCEPTPQAAVATAEALFRGEVLAIPEAAEVRAGGVNDQSARRVGPDDPLQAHTDGFAYGDHLPDQLLLLCAHASPRGGESFVVDGEALVAALGEHPEGRALVERLETVPIDQTEEGMQASVSPVITRTPGGRRMFRRFPFQRPTPVSPTRDDDEWLVAAWWACCAAASLAAPRFKLAEGDLLLVDNYRVLHGREPYEDPERLMWRIWVWTTTSNGLPAARLHSDTRYANAS